MSRFALVTDGTCILPAEVYAQEGIQLLPMHVNFGEDDYTDGVDITRERFYELLSTRKEMPGTSAPSLGECREAYERAMRDGVRDVLAITISKDLSATYSIAASSAQAVDGNVVVIDSRTVAGGIGLIVTACVRARRSGRSFEETVDLAERLAGRPKVYAYIDTFEFLRRSGRATRLQAAVGSLLQVKPLIQVEGGKVEPLDRVRTRSRGVARLKELTVEAVGEGRRVRLAVLHSNAPEGARDLAEWAQRTFHCVEFFAEDAGPTLAARAGPGVLATCFLREEDAA